MGFFSELKDDLSQAVNTILPSEDENGSNDPLLAAAMAEEPETEPVIPSVSAETGEPETDGVVIDAESGGERERSIEDILSETGEPVPEEEAVPAQESSMDGVDLDEMLSKIDLMDTDFSSMEETAEPAADAEDAPVDMLTELAAADMAEEPLPEETSTGIEDAFGSETDAPDADALLDPAAVSGAEEAFDEAPSVEAAEEILPETAEDALMSEMLEQGEQMELFADTRESSEDVFNEAIAAAMSPLADAEAAAEEAMQTAEDVNDAANDASIANALSGAVTAAAAPATEINSIYEPVANKQEEKKMEQTQQQLAAPTDENAVITAGMQIDGDVTTSGSLDVIGKINGNVTAYGKLNVTGTLDGNLTAAEIYAENARITGEVRSQGAAKIGQSTVIIGNIYATSAVVAGAVKGDIDVHGPVVLDTTAIVMGNIKSQSVQINNGAVVEGMCSQVYAEVNPQAFFDGLDNL